MSGSIGAELQAAQAGNSAASAVLQVRQKFTSDILSAGTKRAEEIDKAMLASLTNELDKAIDDAKIMGDQIAMAVAGIGLATTAAGYLNSNDVDDAKKGVRDGMTGTGNVPGRITADTNTQAQALGSVMSETEVKGANDAIANRIQGMSTEDKVKKTPDELRKAAIESLGKDKPPASPFDKPNAEQRLMVGNAVVGQTALMAAKDPQGFGKLSAGQQREQAFKELCKHPPDSERFATAECLGRQAPGVLTNLKKDPANAEKTATGLMRQEMATQISGETKNSLFESNRLPDDPNSPKTKEEIGTRLQARPNFTDAVLDTAPTGSPLRNNFEKETAAQVKKVEDSGHQKRFGTVDQNMMQAMGALAQITAQMMAHQKERDKHTRLMQANAATAANLQG